MERSLNTSAPIKLALAYSLITVILYEFGPYSFPSINKGLLYLFLFACNLAIYAGFKSGASSYKLRPERRVNINRLMKILTIIAVIVCIPKFIIYTGFYSNPLGKITYGVSAFLSGMSDQLYMARQELHNAVGIWRYINYGIILLGPVHWAFIPLSLYFWKRLGGIQKVCAIIVYTVYLLQYICTGTNVGIFDFIITFFVVRIIKKRFENNAITKKKNPKKTRNIVLIIIGVFAVLYAFDFVMGSRIGDKTGSVPIGGSNAYLDKNSFLYVITPNALKPVLLYLTRYLSLPYHALSLSFDVPFDSTFGVGYSWFLLDNMPFSKELWERTYMMKMEGMFNYSHWASWHTAYLWFANDVSHIGVPIVLFILCKVFGTAWRRFITSGCIVSLLQFLLFVKFVLFISENNQVFQASDHLFAFWILLLLSNNHRYTYSW